MRRILATTAALAVAAGSSAVELAGLEETVEDWQRRNGPCYWFPTSARLLSTGTHGEGRRRPLPVPHPLEPGGEVVYQVTGQIGDPDGSPCHSEGTANGWIVAPLRFRWLGVTRTQAVRLNRKLAVTRDPAALTGLSVTPLSR
ncbi:hypothetical protein [Nonomuraea jiangxiensis]|uniref:Uncharacterized protein n=1 Tax=Nonomuraea jiangxiensis TaxID=633440 RepID=A0A1G8Y694_9ACTN|nr:hypothetical protein [Nonomuraea jiangxiensis]SDJ98271.1 hypothetical protein SAMN05421869_113181 [Nonomuraea jiangxiensis]